MTKSCILVLCLLGCAVTSPTNPFTVEKDAGIAQDAYRYEPLDTGPQSWDFNPLPPTPPPSRLWNLPDSSIPPRCECFTYPQRREGGLICFSTFCTQECPVAGFLGNEVCFRVSTD